MKKHTLSKSTFIRGLQCEKSLYLYKHHYNLKDSISPQLQAIFNQGNMVGHLAQELFPGGVDASPSSHFKMQESVVKTKAFIEAGETIIYEATFQYNGVLAALDILVKDEGGWKAYEVKSSTSVSETYINDAAIQYYAIVNSGIDLMDISIVYINNQYVKQGDINIQELFTIESVYDRVQDVLPKIPNQVERFKEVIAKDTVPEINIGLQCSNPYNCDFKEHCWSHIPDYSIFDIANLWTSKKFELYESGVTTFEQIDLQSTSLNENQLLQVTSELNNTSFIDRPKIKNFVDGLQYPLYFLDFETIGPAVPIYNGSRPYQQLVFQYSLHVQYAPDSEIIHSEYLANPKDDPRFEFMKQLIKDCGATGDVIVYNISFESGKLNDLINVFPQYSKELRGIINRLKDLMLPFQKRWYYTPEMKGSYSIKYVLPALVPELSYNNLEIKEGGTASNTFLSMVNGTFEGDLKETRRQLLEYCELDTMAMVEILEVLKAL
jgi:hypothetical protein